MVNHTLRWAMVGLIAASSANLWAATEADPTRPDFFEASTENGEEGSNEEKKEETKLDLTAIMERGEQWVAVINGEVLKVGDSVSGRTIKVIDSHQVVVTGGEGEVALRLWGDDFKQGSTKSDAD